MISMGRRGSGQRSAAKSTTNAFWNLDVRQLQRDGILGRRHFVKWQWTDDDGPVCTIGMRPELDRLNISYRVRSVNSEWEHLQYPVLLERTRCTYGGSRVWFRCPAVGCGRRVAILYLGKVLACRVCYHLNYQVQHEQPRDRLYSAAQKLHLRLGGSGNLTDDLPVKPRGMHWANYEKLSDRLNQLEQAIDMADMLYLFRLVGFCAAS
jgi:hypothetical protein